MSSHVNTYVILISLCVILCFATVSGSSVQNGKVQVRLSCLFISSVTLIARCQPYMVDWWLSSCRNMYFGASHACQSRGIHPFAVCTSQDIRQRQAVLAWDRIQEGTGSLEASPHTNGPLFEQLSQSGKPSSGGQGDDEAASSDNRRRR
jgi:hypothetical protein